MVIQPYHRRARPKAQTYTLFEYNRIDLTEVALPPYPQPDSSGLLPDSRPAANRFFDGRAAAGVSANIGDPASVRVAPRFDGDPNSLLQLVLYPGFVGPPSFFIRLRA